MEPNKQALGIISLAAFVITFFIAFLFVSYQAFQEMVNYLATSNTGA